MSSTDHTWLGRERLLSVITSDLIGDNPPRLAALRYDRWKLLFLEQRANGIDVWQDPLVPLRPPKLTDLRADPFERAQFDSGEYVTWRLERAFALVPAQDVVAQHLKSYVELPPRQKPGSFSLDQVLAKLQEAGSSGKH